MKEKGFGTGAKARLRGYYIPRWARLKKKETIQPQQQAVLRQQTMYSSEIKNLDTELDFTTSVIAVCSTSAATGNIHIVPQGDTATSRDGRKITITSISIQGNFTFTPALSGFSSEDITLYVILDSQCNKANPGITDVFTSNDMGTNQLNLNNSKRFKILKKWVVRLETQAGTAATGFNESMKHIKWYHKCNYQVYYDNTTGAITETTQNSVFFAFGNAQSTGVTRFDGTCRIRFVG